MAGTGTLGFLAGLARGGEKYVQTRHSLEEWKKQQSEQDAAKAQRKHDRVKEEQRLLMTTDWSAFPPEYKTTAITGHNSQEYVVQHPELAIPLETTPVVPQWQQKADYEQSIDEKNMSTDQANRLALLAAQNAPQPMTPEQNLNAVMDTYTSPGGGREAAIAEANLRGVKGPSVPGDTLSALAGLSTGAIPNQLPFDLPPNASENRESRLASKAAFDSFKSIVLGALSNNKSAANWDALLPIANARIMQMYGEQLTPEQIQTIKDGIPELAPGYPETASTAKTKLDIKKSDETSRHNKATEYLTAASLAARTAQNEASNAIRRMSGGRSSGGGSAGGSDGISPAEQRQIQKMYDAYHKQAVGIDGVIRANKADIADLKNGKMTYKDGTKPTPTEVKRAIANLEAENRQLSADRATLESNNKQLQPYLMFTPPPVAGALPGLPGINPPKSANNADKFTLEAVTGKNTDAEIIKYLVDKFGETAANARKKVDWAHREIKRQTR